MIQNVSRPNVIVQQCLPTDSALCEYLVAKPPHNKNNTTNHLDTFINIVKNRMMNHEKPEMILGYVVGEELNEAVIGIMDAALPLSQRTWWRTEIVIQALVDRAQVEYETIKTRIELAQSHHSSMDMAAEVVTVSAADDIQSILIESVKKFKMTLIGAMSQDNESLGVSDDTHGQAYLLNQVDTHLFFSRTLLKAYIEILLLENVVSVQGVFVWLLGDKSDSNSIPTLRWWELAILAIHAGMRNVWTTAIDSAMSDDSTEQQDRNKALTIIQFLDPLLSYAVGQISSHLANTNNDISTKNNRFGSQQVDWIEGFKFVVCQSKYLFVSRMRDQTDLSDAVVHDIWNESDVTGPKLARLLDSSRVSAIELLRRSLERM
jgi:hypothetical protein